jgi:hypothetical protein
VQLKAERTGAEGGCLFNARGAVSDTYPCTGFTVLADGSSDSGTTILEFSPGAGKTTASGAVVLPGSELRVGEYELKDVKEAVFTITTPPDDRVGWICQAGVSGPTVGALKLRITSIDGSAAFGGDTSYTAHGVFEALLIGVAPAGSGTAVLHGEF